MIPVVFDGRLEVEKGFIRLEYIHNKKTATVVLDELGTKGLFPSLGQFKRQVDIWGFRKYKRRRSTTRTEKIPWTLQAGSEMDVLMPWSSSVKNHGHLTPSTLCSRQDASQMLPADISTFVNTGAAFVNSPQSECCAYYVCEWHANTPINQQYPSERYCNLSSDQPRGSTAWSDFEVCCCLPESLSISNYVPMNTAQSQCYHASLTAENGILEPDRLVGSDAPSATSLGLQDYEKLLNENNSYGVENWVNASAQLNEGYGRR